MEKLTVLLLLAAVIALVYSQNSTTTEVTSESIFNIINSTNKLIEESTSSESTTESISIANSTYLPSTSNEEIATTKFVIESIHSIFNISSTSTKASTAFGVTPESVLSNFISTSTPLPTTSAEPESTTLTVLQKWQKMEKSTKIFAKNSIKSLLPGLMQGTGSMNISTECMRNALKLISGLRDIRTWAVSFIDASGKIIDGMLSGTMASLGEYDQCLNIKALEERKGKNHGKVLFTGKYCALDLKPPLPPKKRYYKLNEILDELKNFSKGGNVINEAAAAAHFFHFIAMRVGICVPSGCTESDISQIASRVAKDIDWTINVKRCELKQENEYTPLIIGIMTFMSFFGFMMLIGSLLELYHYYAEKKMTRLPLRFFQCFSLISNFKKLVDVKSSANDLSFLHGFRFLSITWIILGHTYLNINYQLFRGLRSVMEYQKDFFFQAVINATVAVDTFFFIGGLLVCYATVKLMRNFNKPFNFWLYIMHRIIRIIPIYAVVVAFIFLAPILGSGPAWHDCIEKFLNDCYKNWWTNFLFINNFYRTDAICLPQSWYIASDMQLYIAAVIVILPMVKWPRVGISVAVLGILASMIGSGAMTYFNDYPPTMLFVHPDPEQRIVHWADIYFKPYSHIGPYCIGLLTGYLFITKPKIRLSLCTRIIGWCCAIISNMAVLYGVWEWNKGGDPTPAETILYSSCHRVAWTLGVAWVAINCFSGQGGFVNYILCWKCWIPLGRLTYAAYLIHPIVQIAAIGHVRMRLQTTHYFAVWIFFGHLLGTYGSSFVASMLVEAPSIALEKLILSGLKLSSEPAANGNAHLANGKAVTNENEIESNNVARNEHTSRL